MPYPMVFFSFVALEGGRPEHRRYNEWHQLDHRPENLALPGVAWGDRWARTKTGSQAVPEYQDVDYIAMYWFNEPLDQSLAEWDALSTDSFQWGRGPMLPGVRRPLLSFFRPVKGYAAASALVSADVLPYRPCRGLHMTLTRFSEAYSDATHDHHVWEDRELMPQLLAVDGVAGAWTFAFDHHQQHESMPLRTTTSDVPGGLRMRLVYLDGDPSTTTERVRAVIRSAQDRLPAAAASNKVTLLETEATTIIPWQDW